jgi:hypothetical protein
MHCSLGEGTPSVIVGAFPVRHAQEADGFDSMVTFDQGGLMVKNRAGPRGCDKPQATPMSASIAAPPVIGSVANDFPSAGEIGGGQ